MPTPRFRAAPTVITLITIGPTIRRLLPRYLITFEIFNFLEKNREIFPIIMKCDTGIHQHGYAQGILPEIHVHHDNHDDHHEANHHLHDDDYDDNDDP